MLAVVLATTLGFSAAMAAGLVAYALALLALSGFPSAPAVFT